VTVGFDLVADAVPTRDAATVVLARPSPAGPEIFFVKRHADVRFMGGAYVFPGGKLDGADCDEALRCDLGESDASARLGESDGRRARGLFVAALRECFEEAGVLLVDATPEPDELAQMRALVATNPGALAAEIATRGWTFRATALHAFARWVTPRGETRRYDTRFFAAQVPENTVAAHDTGETVASAWLRPVDALARARDGQIVLVPPTYRTVQWLADCETVDEILALASTPPPRFEPVVRTDDEGTLWIVLPGDPLHPEPAPEFPPRSHPSVVRAAAETVRVTRFAYDGGAWRPSRG